MRSIRRSPEPSGILPFFAILAVLLGLAVGCGERSTPAEPTPPAPGEPAPPRISESQALLDLARTRAVGAQKRISILEQILSDYPNAPETEESLSLLADSLANFGRVDEAYGRYQELIRRFPAGIFNAKAHAYSIGYAHNVSKDPEALAMALHAAVEDLGACLDKHPEELLGPAAIIRANAQLELEDWEGALETYRRMVSAPPTDAPEREEYRITASFHIGNVRERQGKRQDARRAFEEARSLLAKTTSLDPGRRAALDEGIRRALDSLEESGD